MITHEEEQHRLQQALNRINKAKDVETVVMAATALCILITLTGLVNLTWLVAIGANAICFTSGYLRRCVEND